MSACIMTCITGWRDLLRPIRDGLRDNLPEKPPVEDKERQRQQRLDALKGFAYFHTFDELDRWRADNVLPLQRANTPLLQRPYAGPKEASKKAKLTLIHDFAGNYHNYERNEGSSVIQSEDDSIESDLDKRYILNWHQYVEKFVYFSHKLICIPPPSWTNSLHRNGVKSFGTFLVEPGSVMIERMLIRERRPGFRSTGWSYPLATRLAEMARVYGFDGWLINIEKTFPMLSWSEERLVGFLEQLKVEVGDGHVIWYDALDVHNRVKYQNSLTEDNLAFAMAAGSILTNYAWTLEKAAKAKLLALANNLPLDRVIFGIDIWAQNTQKTGPKRETWPLKCGGGTMTGRGVYDLSKLGFSAGLFAPAWAVEHEYHSNIPCALERAMWAGEALEDNEGCDCETGTHNSNFYQHWPITSSALERPVGSDVFFFTDFRSPIYKEGNNIRTSIGTAAALPMALQTGESPGCIQVVSVEAGLGVIIDGSKAGGDAQSNSRHTLRLFNLKVIKHERSSMVTTINYQNVKIPAGTKISVTYHIDEGDCTLDLPASGTKASRVWSVDEYRCYTGLSINFEGVMPQGRTQVLNIHNLCIMEQDAEGADTTIDSGWIESTSVGTDHFLLLCWSLNITGKSHGLPESPTTGSVSYFIINQDKSRRVYATQYLLESVTPDEKDKEVSFQIDGYGFTGKKITSKTVRLRIPRDPGDSEHSNSEQVDEVDDKAEDDTRRLLFGERRSYRTIRSHD